MSSNGQAERHSEQHCEQAAEEHPAEILQMFEEALDRPESFRVRAQFDRRGLGPHGVFSIGLEQGDSVAPVGGR